MPRSRGLQRWWMDNTNAGSARQSAAQRPRSKGRRGLTVSKALRVLQALYKQGVGTIVDMHQDFYSRWLNKGCGEGFPR